MTKRKKLWPVLVEGILANFLLGAMFTWSVYRAPLLALFPAWTEGMLSIVFGCHNVFVCLGILIGGRLAQRIPMRRLFFALACMMGIGFGSYALLPLGNPTLSYLMVLVLFGMLSSFGVGMGINLVQSATLPWFPDHAGLVSGALFMSLGVSSFVLAAVSQRILPLLGALNSLAVIGAGLFIIAMGILCDRKSLCLPANGELKVLTNEGGITTGEMAKKLSFWLLLIWNGCLRAIGFILLDHAAGVAVAFAATALAGMLISPANAGGSLLLGALLDKTGLRRNILTICLLMLAGVALLIVGALANSALLIILGLVLGGVSYGGSSSAYSAAIKRVYGGKYYSANYGFANLSMGLGALISAFSGIVLDAHGGDYMSIFIMSAILLVPILICGGGLMKVKLPRY